MTKKTETEEEDKEGGSEREIDKTAEPIEKRGKIIENYAG